MDMYERISGVVYRIIDEETLIMKTENNSIYTLSKVGTSIWEKISSKQKLNSIVDAVCNEFDIERSIATKEVSNFLDSLVENGLVLKNIE